MARPLVAARQRPSSAVSPCARVLLTSLVGLAAAGCSRPAPHFSEQNARAHVTQLAGTIGSRPTGTDANRRAREYVIEQLRFYGFHVRVQDAEAQRPSVGLTARVANVIAIHPGRRAEAIALVAHYDSVPTSPGAGDDGLGVAVALEAGRLLAADADRQHTLMVLLTDAEEHGLMGAEAIVRDPEVQARLRAYINVEAAGADEPALLFQAGPGNGWLLRTWAQAAPRPRGGSYMLEVYRRLPNDTDFTVFARAGWPGLNFAAAGDSYAYHTSRDTPDRLTRAVVERMGRSVLATARALDAADVTARTDEQPVYFDIAGRWAGAFAPALGRTLSIVALVLGLVAWLRALRVVLDERGGLGVVLTLLWAAIGLALVAGALVGSAALLRAVREVYHPWYAHPWRFWVLLATAGVLVIELLLRLGERLPAALRAVRHPAAAWMVTLLAWLALTAGVEWTAPAAAYLWALPLLAAALVVALAPRARGIGARLAATLVLCVVGVTWLPEARDMLAFAIPMLGRVPIVTPVFVLPTALLAVGVMVGPPVLALVVAGAVAPSDARLGRGRLRERALLTPTLVLVFTAAFGACYFGEAYTADRPLWRAAYYVADHAAGRAMWEVGSVEPGLDLALGSGAPDGWVPAGGDPLLGPALAPRMRHPFRFRAPGTVVAPPVTAELRITGVGESASIEVLATTSEPGLLIAFALPPSIVPLRSSLPGHVRDGWWTAAYAGAPAGTVSLTATLPPGAASRAGELRVIAIAPGLPGGTGWLRQPAWLDGTRAAWAASSVHVVAPIAVQPVPPLR